MVYQTNKKKRKKEANWHYYLLVKRSILFDLASILGDFEIGSLGYVWFPENMRENVRERI